MTVKTIFSMISVFLMLFAIIGISWWAFSPRRKKRFDDAANLPFADESELEKQQHKEQDEQEIHPHSDEQR